MQERVGSPDRDRLSVLVAVLLLGCVLYRFAELPEQAFDVVLFGSPLEIRVTGMWLLVILTVALACSGTNLVLHGHPRLGGDAKRPSFVSWILPAVLVGLSVYLLDLASSGRVWAAGLGLLGLVFSLTVSAEYLALSPDAPGHLRARLGLNVLAYLLAFVLFTAAYGARARSIVTATLTLIAGGLLALDLLSVANVEFRRVLPYAGGVGLVVGEGMWALNYWRLGGATGGLVLLLLFYATVNVAQQHLLGRLKPAVLAELAAVTAVVLTIAVVWAP